MTYKSVVISLVLLLVYSFVSVYLISYYLSKEEENESLLNSNCSLQEENRKLLNEREKVLNESKRLRYEVEKLQSEEDLEDKMFMDRVNKMIDIVNKKAKEKVKVSKDDRGK